MNDTLFHSNIFIVIMLYLSPNYQIDKVYIMI